jgi:hypothetical protein
MGMNMKDKLPAINSLLANPPASFGFSDEEIEEIVRGEHLVLHLETIDNGHYIQNFLPQVQWCQALANILVQEPESDEPVFNQSYSEEEIPIANKLREVLALYGTAWEASFMVEAIGSDPTGLEMVRRFWDLKQYILALVKRDFPDAEFNEFNLSKETAGKSAYAQADRREDGQSHRVQSS